MIREAQASLFLYILQPNKHVGVIYEETLTGFGKRANPISTNVPNGEGTHNFDGFDNIYISYTISQITNDAYRIGL
jgi:hypothetical protein